MREIAACKTCQERKELINELNSIGKRDGLFMREKKRTRDPITKVNGYVEDLDECPNCRKNSRPIAMNDFGANFEQTQHVHKCGVCGTRLPKDGDAAYKNASVCSDLGEHENGELHQYIRKR